ncbi:unnamed protein product [Brassicogethes aeneus]|uniref:C2H2-type domain-containing protein n=1 Tax=Brassicogethes aeneus TaxID=1431903 RepID=A0A9P0FM31_BRAAE|nr:unnamed protein product [Brassicogethes aeneus]
MSVMCFICKKIFANQSSHNRHVREVHKIYPKPSSYGEGSRWCNCCLEENCGNTFKNRKQLICHLEENHSIQFEKYYSVKASVNEFKNWKNDIEKVNDCYYVLKSKAASTIGEVLYYNCNRSKTSYSTKDEAQMKRLQKCQGSCKMTHSCTSSIKVTSENGKYHIEWQKTHYGHDFEQKHIRLPKPERHCIASKLISGVTTQRILESTRDKIGDPLKRIDLLTAKDIRNIKSSFNIESRDGKKHPNDAFSVDLWVQECMSGEENPILLYKPQGQDHSLLANNDFCIILMNKFQRQMIQSFPNIIAVDSTHGLNGYDFEMTSIMVIDEFHHGFPIAEMFSNRKDIVIQNIFFTSVRESAGIYIYIYIYLNVVFHGWRNVKKY